MQLPAFVVNPASPTPVTYSAHTLTQRGQRQPTRTEVQPHMRSHPQSDRQIGKHITGVSPQTHKHTHRQNRHTPPFTVLALFTHDHHSSAAVNPIIPQIPASQHYFMCFAETHVFFSYLKAGVIQALLNNAD